MIGNQLSLITEHWDDAFQQLFAEVKREFVLVAPFIGEQPTKRLCECLSARKSPISVYCITNFSPQSLAKGTLDITALIALATCTTDIHIYHLGNLHAKVYIADGRTALITSANFTMQGLQRNQEIGIRLADAHLARQLRARIKRLMNISTPLGLSDLHFLETETSALRATVQEPHLKKHPSFRAIQNKLIQAHLQALPRENNTEETVSENQIFAKTILHLLREQGPLRTEELHPLIQALHPELCDDSVERIINGIRFGKRWKHMVRNAQQYLKRKGLITYDPQRRVWFIPTNHPPQQQPLK